MQQTNDVGNFLELCHYHLSLHLGVFSSRRPRFQTYEAESYRRSRYNRNHGIPRSGNDGGEGGVAMAGGSIIHIIIPRYVLSVT